MSKMLGFQAPGSRALRDWLERFHDAEAVARARERALELDLKSSVPEPTEGLRGLQAVVGVSARAAAARQPGGSPAVATVDLDATIVESNKRSATVAYTGERGYQPVVAVWAEAGVVLATEFRDGNVPASKDPLRCARLAFAELPPSVRVFGFRGDSACDNNDLYGWLEDPEREGGPRGRIDYAISVRMVPEVGRPPRAASPKMRGRRSTANRTARSSSGPSSTTSPACAPRTSMRAPGAASGSASSSPRASSSTTGTTASTSPWRPTGRSRAKRSSNGTAGRRARSSTSTTK
ncbi:MAG: hypothetical protein ACOX5G_11430 [Kiritimatiellia bacterium]